MNGPDPENMSLEAIDKAFGVDIQKISQFVFLDGQIFKDHMVAVFSQEPILEGCLLSEQELRQQVQKHLANSMHLAADIGNPLLQIIQRCRVSYKRGGVFSLKRIHAKFITGEYYLDIQFMVNEMS